MFKRFFSLLVLAILQRGTVDVGQIKIQGVATCLFLCMDACGNVYGTVSRANGFRFFCNYPKHALIRCVINPLKEGSDDTFFSHLW